MGVVIAFRLLITSREVGKLYTLLHITVIQYSISRYKSCNSCTSFRYIRILTLLSFSSLLCPPPLFYFPSLSSHIFVSPSPSSLFLPPSLLFAHSLPFPPYLSRLLLLQQSPYFLVPTFLPPPLLRPPPLFCSLLSFSPLAFPSFSLFSLACFPPLNSLPIFSPLLPSHGLW